MRGPLTWDSRYVVNGHILIMGYSGTGKTHTLRHMIRCMAKTYTPSQKTPQPLRVHVFDIHDDIDTPDEVPSSELILSETSVHGLNPLIVESNPHSGGVRKAIQNFVNIINKTSRQLGERQESVLRGLMADLYFANGFDAKRPETWTLSGTTYGGRAKKYPTVKDLYNYCISKYKLMTMGGDYSSSSALESLNREMAALRSELAEKNVAMDPALAEQFDATHLQIKKLVGVWKSRYPAESEGIDCTGRLEKLGKVMSSVEKQARDESTVKDATVSKRFTELKDKAKDAYRDYVDSILTGKELGNYLRYDSRSTIKSVADRIGNLNDCGVFSGSGLPFDQDKTVWRYRLKHLGEDEKRMFVFFRLKELFDAALRRGVQDTICEVIILDEAKKFLDNDPDNILVKLVNEIRKFGTMVVCASQSFTHFSDDFMTSAATKVILGVSDVDMDKTAKKVQVTRESLNYIRPKQIALIQIKQDLPVSDQLSSFQGKWRLTQLVA